MGSVDLGDRTVVVTGASSGLGERTALVLAAGGAHVVLAVRDATRGEASRARIAAVVPDARLEVSQLDLAELRSVQAFADRWDDRPLDILINNAGLVTTTDQRTVDGFELHMGVNHLGHFALTSRLMPALLRSSYARVVQVSSLMHRSTGRLDRALGDARGNRTGDAYAQSKLACGLFGLELDRRAKDAGQHLTSVVAHPGWSHTNLFASHGSMPRFGRLIGGVSHLLASDATHGALSQLRAATDLTLLGGEFIGPQFLMWGRPRRERPARNMSDPGAAARLWDDSIRATGTDPGAAWR